MTLTVISLGFGSRTGTAGVVTLGFGTSGSTPIQPTPNPGSGSSGANAPWRPPGWLLDMLEDEERLAREEKKIKREIKALTKKKESLQEKLATPSLRVDYGALIAAVQDIMAKLQALMDNYRLIRHALDDLEESQEADELMDLMSALNRTLH